MDAGLLQGVSYTGAYPVGPTWPLRAGSRDIGALNGVAALDDKKGVTQCRNSEDAQKT